MLKIIENRCKSLYSDIKIVEVAWLPNDRTEGRMYSPLATYLRATIANKVIEKDVLTVNDFLLAQYHDTAH
jgi:hypothetical protein